jgi:hypothetical protein
MALGLRIGKPYFNLLTSGIGLYLVCQVPLAYGSTPSPHIGECKGRIGLSPPAAYPTTIGHEAIKGSL